MSHKFRPRIHWLIKAFDSCIKSILLKNRVLKLSFKPERVVDLPEAIKVFSLDFN